jgi:tripartite ATP-independent transporter DctP family solute receptor
MRRIAAALIAALACATALAQTTALKLGHILPPTSPEHQAFLFLADKIKQRTGGSVELQVFPSSQLGAVNVMLESLQAGQLDMMVELLEWYGNWDKRFGVFGVPYLFRDREHFSRFLATPQFKEMLADLEKSRSLVYLKDPINWWFMSDRTLLSKKPINTPADMKGVKLRMFQARVPVLSWQTLGANTIIIPWGETYTALATGTVEAVTARVEAHYQMKQTEVAKYMTVTKEYFQIYIPVMSRKTVERLTPQQMNAIRDAARESGEHFTKLSADAAKEMQAKVRSEHGVTILEPSLAPWQQAMAPAYAKFEEEGVIPKGMIKQIIDLK